MNEDLDRSKSMPFFIQADEDPDGTPTPWGTRWVAFYKYEDEESYEKGEWSELHVHEYDEDGNWLEKSIII